MKATLTIKKLSIKETYIRNQIIMKTFKILLFTFIITGTSCNQNVDPNYHFDYETIVTELPVNLKNINSSFDDYNSNLPYPAFGYGIFFSTNRNSSGNNFDIIHKNMDISYHPKDDILNIKTIFDSESNSRYESKILETINTDFDEYGPFHYFGEGTYEYFFYANNASGDFDIKYASSKKSDFGAYTSPGIINAPKSFESINSASDDYYPCLFNGNKSLVFCSNRDKVFDIYETTFNENEINPDYQSTTKHTIVKNTTLSSEKNDKCPFIAGNIMIFTSDREGGYGGYDLYFSQYLDGKWSQPKNLGDKINSEYDEYRPIIVLFREFDDTMLIFSSNRPGGKGGFDLYAARTKTMPKPDYYTY